MKNLASVPVVGNRVNTDNLNLVQMAYVRLCSGDFSCYVEHPIDRWLDYLL